MTEIPKTTGFFESFDGTQVYYEVRGTGRPLIMTYGIACLMNHWHYQTRYFSEKYQTILFDYRGHHKSPKPQNRKHLSIEAIGKDLIGLVNHLCIDKASFWSHSFGSQVLLSAYLDNPDVFANMVLINGFARNPIQKMFGGDFAIRSFQIMKKLYDKAPSTSGKIWQSLMNNPLTHQLSTVIGGFNLDLTHLNDVEIYCRGVGAMDLEVFIPLFEQMMDFDGRRSLSSIEMPTLIIGGTKDSVTPCWHQEELHNGIDNSELFIVPYGSHCTQLDMPEYVNLRIEKFLITNKY